MKKIIGPAQVEQIKLQILRAHITNQDLAYCLRTIEYLIQTLRRPTDNVVIESLTANAVISYTRCFNSEFSFSLSADIYENVLPSGSSSDQVTERQFHNLIMNYRNKHIAHSDDFLKAMIVGGVNLNGEYGVGPITAIRVLHEDENFYTSIGRLAQKAIQVVATRSNGLQQKLIELLQAGTATLTTEDATITPIPLGISPQELWGLSER